MLQRGNASKPGGKRVESKSGKPSTLRSSFLEDQSMTEQRTADRSPLQRDQSVTEQRTADSLFSPFNSAEQRTADRSPFQKAQSVSEQRTADRRPPKPKTEEPKVTPPAARDIQQEPVGQYVYNSHTM